jgi:hypothetical protein
MTDASAACRASSAEPLDFDARRARRARRAAAAAEPLGSEPATSDVTDPDGASTAIAAHHTDRAAPRAASGERRHRPRAPRAEKKATADSATTGAEAELAGESLLLPEGSAAPAAATAVDVLGKKAGRSHTLKRAQRKQQQAAAALGGE